ncbi:MAG: hypothetical protein JSS72_09405 [Armatimonadetes bacterium]|nr:hypothetical protein [Armatimonadota bacterium]
MLDNTAGQIVDTIIALMCLPLSFILYYRIERLLGDASRVDRMRVGCAGTIGTIVVTAVFLQLVADFSLAFVFAGLITIPFFIAFGNIALRSPRTDDEPPGKRH